MQNVKPGAFQPDPETRWTARQERFLSLLRQEGYQKQKISTLCRQAGFNNPTPWYIAMEDERFAQEVAAYGFTIKRQTPARWAEAKQRFLTLLQVEEHRCWSITCLCREAGYESLAPWYQAIKDPQFVQAVTSLGVRVKRHINEYPSHLEVEIATNPEEELAKDRWDLRRLKKDYPKHNAPSDLIVDFTWITNPMLRQQVKQYFRQRLLKWRGTTPVSTLFDMKPLLKHLPPQVHIGTLSREHIEAFLPSLEKLSKRGASRTMWACKAMLEYMATSLAWTGPRPPRFLIWPEEVPSQPGTMPRPIPPEVLDQLDDLLDEAMKAIKVNEAPPYLSPTLWDALLTLRHTGIRAEDLCHLKAPDASGRNGCLEQDSEGYWWIRIDHTNTKTNREHRIPTKMSDGVIDALHRQQERIKQVPNHFEEHYLFRTDKGVLSYGEVARALQKLNTSLMYEKRPYTIAPHQFRHTIATDMIEQGTDIYTVKEFLGHVSLAMTEKYVKIYKKTLKAKYDAYRAKKEQTYAATMLAKEVEANHDAGETDGGWVEGKVGTLYRSPLPNGVGNCVHLAQLDPCPIPPNCDTCPKLQATRRHLPVWENKVQSLLITVEALTENPIYHRARQKHEQELRHAEKVVETIRKEGFWDGRIHNTHQPEG